MIRFGKKKKIIISSLRLTTIGYININDLLSFYVEINNLNYT